LEELLRRCWAMLEYWEVLLLVMLDMLDMTVPFRE
jgi:hypothetical protein